MSLLTAQSALIRPIGSLERLFFRYSERHPAHFLLAAEFDGILDDQQLRRALDSVQRRHPLLSVHVEDHPSTHLGFYRAQAIAPIPMTVHHGRSDWQSLAATELAMPFDRSVAPLLRVTLATTATASVVLLTFDHTIADGISSVHVLDDLIAALNGRQLTNLPVPPAIEDLIDGSLEGTASTEIAVPDERMAEPTTQRPFDGSAPFLHTVAMTEADTARLAVRCRAERTTVHAANKHPRTDGRRQRLRRILHWHMHRSGAR
jgi:hypothetical protein